MAERSGEFSVVRPNISNRKRASNYTAAFSVDRQEMRKLRPFGIPPIIT